jgi:hypothetical protein
MNEKKAGTRETRGAYQKAGKKERVFILDQYIRLSGYNRKHAVRVLSKPFGKSTTLVIGGNTAVCKAEKSQSRKTRLGKPIYTPDACHIGAADRPPAQARPGFSRFWRKNRMTICLNWVITDW